MIAEINTETKTIKLKTSVSFNELMEFVNEFGLGEYTIEVTGDLINHLPNYPLYRAPSTVPTYVPHTIIT